MHAVTTEGVSRRYGRRWALIDVTLDVPRGSVAVVAGRNGSGKSTLLRVLATAIRPNLGRAAIEGFDVVEARDDARHAVALLGHASYLYDSLTARENLVIVARFLGRSTSDVVDALREVGLEPRADDVVSTFSAGMRKRLSFARVLLQRPRVVLLDEPYGQLDPPGFAMVDDFVTRFRRDGATVVMATHQLARGASLGDIAFTLAEGRLQWQGSAAELVRQEGSTAES